MQQITYSPDTDALLAEVEAKSPSLVITQEDGSKSIGPLTKTPTHRNGLETVSVVKGLPVELQGLVNLQVLGVITGAPYNAVATFTDSAAQATYERVTEVLIPIEGVDPDGAAYAAVKPYLIGVVG
jgi:hypothetical protein